METKGVIMVLLIMGVVVADAKSCCRNTLGRNCYNSCRFLGTSRPTCAELCDCQFVDKPPCPSGYPRGVLEISAGTSTTSTTISDYCKLGCASSVCDAMITKLNSAEDGVEEETKLAMEHCNIACSELCNNNKAVAATA